ncbi:MAG: hypothetical protein CVV47_11810 [Spirochaetae bacterium HGW-Spirochaetae-3]|jgi:DNA-binding transcriptional MerR regulator|nr:MAG: hypothetical protein CVV47_11810 [Spirochaetae bacterium HGW-Spirochaetae-3]
MKNAFQFGAKEIRQLTGISPETLRHYVECSILKPLQVDENNYRKYSSQNMIDVLHARIYRGLGLPIQSIIQRSESGPEEQDAVLVRHKAILERDVLRLQLKLDRMRQEIEFLGTARRRLDCVRIRSADEAPSVYRITLLDAARGKTRIPEIMSRVDEWMRYPQHLQVALHVPEAAILDPGIDELPVSLGLSVRMETAISLELDTSPPAEFFPNKAHVGTLIATTDPLNLRRRDLLPLLDTVRARGLRLEGGLIGRLCYIVDSEKGRHYYFSANLCVA